MSKSAAILTIYNADKMTPNGREQIAKWLNRQAKDLVKLGDQYSKRLICRYQYSDASCIRIANKE